MTGTWRSVDWHRVRGVTLKDFGEEGEGRVKESGKKACGKVCIEMQACEAPKRQKERRERETVRER